MFGPGGAWALTGNAFANSMIAGGISGGIAGGKQGTLQGALSGGLFYGAGQLGNAWGTMLPAALVTYGAVLDGPTQVLSPHAIDRIRR